MKKERVLESRYHVLSGGLAWMPVVFAMLAACMGSGDSQQTSVDALGQRVEAASLLLLQNQPIAYTDPSLIPDQGTFDYSGFVLGQLENTTDEVTDSLTGLLSLAVDFGTAELLSGRAYDFMDEDGVALEGQLAITSGSLDRTGNPSVDATLTFSGSGVLLDARERQLTLNATFEGDFLNSDAGAMLGNIAGRVTVDGTTQLIGGTFIAERD